MAIQGKGIFGGFSGKIGKIQGVRKFSRDTIQGLPKFKTRKNNFIRTSQLVPMVQELNAVVGLGYCENGTGTNSRNNTGSGSISFEGKVGSYSWKKTGANSTYFTMFAEEYKGINETDYILSITQFNFLTRVSNFGLHSYNGSAQANNEIFQVSWIGSELWFLRGFSLDSMVKEFEITWYTESKMVIIFDMFAAGTRVDEVTIEKPEGEFLL